jgi:hypothetical protein
MPQKDAEGQVAGGEPQGKTGGPDDDDSPVEGKDQAYLGTFKTKEDAEKGLQDLQEILRRTQSDKDKAVAENKKLQDQFLSKLTESVSQLSQPKEEAPRVDVDSLVKRIDDEGGKAIVDILGSYLNEYETKLTAAQKAEVERIQKQYDEKLGQLTAAVRSVDPKYLNHRETVEKLEEMGLKDRELAIKVAELMDKTEQPPRPDIPGTTGSDRVTDKAPPAKLSDEAKALLESSAHIGKISPEEEKQLLAMRGGK